ncbi:hypothetical protein [Dactylosporangium sp. NPDC051484]|uniref:hypothetical protein n=1 Tax=Dactylosporangium sp. NPDC051484 TaxID=3154942 RepID=UPI00344E986C
MHKKQHVHSVMSRKVVAAEVVVGGVGGQDVPGGVEEGVCGGGHGAFAAAAGGDAAELATSTPPATVTHNFSAIQDCRHGTRGSWRAPRIADARRMIMETLLAGCRYQPMCGRS